MDLTAHTAARRPGPSVTGAPQAWMEHARTGPVSRASSAAAPPIGPAVPQGTPGDTTPGQACPVPGTDHRRYQC